MLNKIYAWTFVLLCTLLVSCGSDHFTIEGALADIDEYEKYCAANPDFKNNQTLATIEHIKENYKERLEKHDFL